MSWNDGYVVDVPYTEHAFREMTPAWLSLVSLLNDQPPIDTTRPFTYMELGCGRGLTATTVAAANPSAEVWACDFNPPHIERARQLAAAAGLTNCSFDETSFEELALDRELGPAHADVIALHGIYSWVSPTNRQHIIEIIRQRLVPGGLVYVSYDVPTGWAAMLPVQQAMRLQVRTDRRRSDIAIRSAVATISQLAEDGARSFPLPPPEQSTLDSLHAHDPAYVAHEYLGGSFSPLMFADVAADLSAAKCRFLGSTSIPDAVLSLRVPADLLDTVRSAPDVALRETVCDLATQRMFRADVFRRGMLLVSGPDHRRHLDDLQLVNGGTSFDPAKPIATGAGSAQLDAAHYAPLVGRLLDGPATVGELRRTPALEGRSDDEVKTSIALLVAGAYAEPVLPGWEGNGAVDSAARLNRTLIDAARRGDFRGLLISPATGGVIGLPLLVALTVGEAWDGAAVDESALAEAVARRARALQLPILLHGVALTDEMAQREVVTQSVRQAMELLSGPLGRLGIRAPEPRRAQPGGRRRRG